MVVCCRKDLPKGPEMNTSLKSAVGVTNAAVSYCQCHGDEETHSPEMGFTISPFVIEINIK